MDKMLAIMGLKYLANKTNGYATYIGAAGIALTGFMTIITGVVGVLGNLYPDSGLPATDLSEAVDTVLVGCGTVAGAITGAGLRRAVDKTKQ